MMQEEKKTTFSVIIPLYNKEREIEATIRSVLAQTHQPKEIVIVNDGSTDNSAEVVRNINSPLIRLIDQPNAGVCAARNRAMEEATGSHMAFIDADDQWKEGFLEEISALIDEFPECGLYCTSFMVVSDEGLHRAKCPEMRGVVENFFRESVNNYIAIPSASVVPRVVIDDVGGFPEGMKLGEDLYLWIKIARKYSVCFSPKPLMLYMKEASNRSAAIYKPEQTAYSFEDLFNPADTETAFWQNEFLARCAIGKALTVTAKGDTEFGLRTERFFSYTRHYRLGLWKLRIFNRIPRSLRLPLHNFYNRLAWLLARKGL